MEFEFDEDQRLLQQMVRETVAKSRSLPAEQLWTTYLDLGWLEAPAVELAIVLEELGYVADPTPFLATATWFAPLAGRLPAGSGTGVCDGTGRFVLDADRADEIALVTRDGVVIASGPELNAERVATFDPTLHVAHVNAPDLVPGIPDLALMGLAISTVGSCRRILDLAVAHVKFRAEFSAFLDAHLPSEAEATPRPRSSSDMPEWAGRWQRALFDAGWLLPGNPPEYGGRNATLPQQLAYLEELSERRIYHSFNPQGLGIIAASILTFGTQQQKQRWAVPILRAEITASLGMSEPGAGSDLAGLRTRAVLDGDYFVVNGQKVWTSGAHDADVLLTFVRTDPDAPKHKGISVLLIPTGTEGVASRPFASIAGPDDLDFNEVFFTDVRVPRENLIGQLNQGWTVAHGSLGHERTLLWLSFAERLGDLIRDAPSHQEWYATLLMDAQALRLLGYRQLSAAKGGGDRHPAELSVLKLLGSEAVQAASLHALEEQGPAGLVHPAVTGPYNHMNNDAFIASWFERYVRSFAGTIAGGTSEIQRNIIAERILGLPR